MFIDLVSIDVRAGDGGDGLISFRREKHVSRGGPDGGNGGNGGNIVFEASGNEYDLARFRLMKSVRAEDGQAGGKNRRSGRSGADVVVDLPCGTIVRDAESGELLADLTRPGQSFVAARGGEGGFGNARFKSSSRQAPRLAEKGLAGGKLRLSCELKLLAEVGLVGLPNAGKSTLLRAVTRARPKVGAYPFTTLEPHLGVAENGLRLADIPGLIAGAAEGKGLGHRFLRHIERTLVILQLLDCLSTEPEADCDRIAAELEAYNPELLKRPRLLVLTKIDRLGEKDVAGLIRRLRRHLGKAADIRAVSAFSGSNLADLLKDVRHLVDSERERLSQVAEEGGDGEPVVFRLEEDADDFRIERTADGRFLVLGGSIERLALKTDFANHYARQRLFGALEKMGALKQLQALGWQAEELVFGRQAVGPLRPEAAEARPERGRRG